MKITDIKANDISCFNLEEIIEDFAKKTTVVALIVQLKNGQRIQHEINDGFGIHSCNEFLRSLKLISLDMIEFRNYAEYDITVTFLNQLFSIRKEMEDVCGENYDEISVSAYQGYECILNQLLAKHHMARKGWEYAMNRRPLKDWVAEAVALLG